VTSKYRQNSKETGGIPRHMNPPHPLSSYMSNVIVESLVAQNAGVCGSLATRVPSAGEDEENIEVHARNLYERPRLSKYTSKVARPCSRSSGLKG
jgi:hypothetical protein